MNRHKSGQSRQKHKKEMQYMDDTNNQDNQHLNAQGSNTMSHHKSNSNIATQQTTSQQNNSAAQAQFTRGACPTNSTSQHTRGKSTHNKQSAKSSTTSQPPPQNQSTSGHHAQSQKQQTLTTQHVTEKTQYQAANDKMATVQKTIQQKNMVQISTAQIEAAQRKLAQEIQDDSSFDESHVDNRPSSKSVSQYEETQDDDQLNPLEFDCQEDQRSLTAKKGKRGQEGKRLPTTKNSMASSYMISHADFDDSECNLACSSNSMSPEHAIHTVVVGAMVQQQQATHAGNSAKSCWLNNNNDRQDSPDKPSKWILTSPQDMSKDNNDFTPATPHTKTNASQGTDQKQQSGRRVDASPSDQQQYNEITSYTNGNMAEIVLDEEDEALKREKAEFMYMFEGAMSVIQETDEPDDEMTIKHSAQSSVLQLQRYDSIATPNERMSKEPMPNRPHEFVMISPHKIMFKNVQSMSQANGKRQQKKIQIIKESSNGSIQEDSVTSQVESMDEITKPSILTNQPEPKSISFIDDNTNTTFSKLSDLTKNCIQQQQLSKTLQNTSNHINNSSAEKHSTSSKHRSPKKSSHSGSQSSSQLKSYLQRQQELLKNNMVPQDCSNSSRGGGPQQHQVYRSPERPPQPKNLSHAPSNNPSTKNTASVLREAEARSNRNNKNATKPDTVDDKAKTKTIENKKQIEKLAKKQEQDTLVAQVTEQLQKVQVAANFAQREQPGTSQNQPDTIASQPLTATKVQQKSEERAQMKTPVRLQEDSSKNLKLQICSPQTEHNRLILSPVEKQLSQAEIEMYNLRMQALNTSIVKLREDMKERSVSVFKECKTFNMNNQQSHSLEEKLDYEFLERVMQVYAFFTSCLNLVLLNDKQAHKLLILQPMIEKHITELKIDKLTLQASSTDLFDHPDNTLSSIGGGPSFNNSVASMNGTWLNHLNGGKSLSITPRRDPSIEGLPTPQSANTRSNLLQVAQKLQHLDTLLQIAQQVLQLNSLKHRLIVDNRKSRSISKTNSEQQAAPQKTLRGAFSSDQIGMNTNHRELLVNNQQQQQQPQPSGPLFTGQKNLLQNGKQLKKQQSSCPKNKQSQQLKNSDDISQQKGQMINRPESPPRIKLEIQSNSSKNVVQQSDPYFTAQQHSQQQQNTKSRAAKPKRAVEITNKNDNPVGSRRNPKQITDEISNGAPCGEQKIIFHPPQKESTSKIYRRNCSDGQLTGKSKGSSSSVTNEKQGNQVTQQQLQQQPQLINSRWSDTTQDLSNRRKQATDSYFHTNNQSQLALQQQQQSANSAIISPKNQKSSQQIPSKQQLQQQQQQQQKIVGGTGNHSRGGSGSNRMLNLEKAKLSNESFNKTMLQQNSQIQSNSNTHMNAQSTKSTERQTQDQTVIVQGQNSVPSTSKNNFTAGVCQNNSFGVTNYSAGSSGRNQNAANNLQDYQPNQTFSQQPRQKQGSLKQIKDNCESFISVLQHPETHPDLATGQSQVTSQVQEMDESEFIDRNQEKKWHTREMGCREVELDCKGNLVLDSGSNHSSQIQKSRNDGNQPANLVVSWRSEESYFSGNQKKNSKKTSSKKQNKPLPNNFSKTILLEKQKRGSLSPHSNNPTSPYQNKKNSSSKNDLALASNYMSSGQKKCSKTIKTNTAFQSETFSEMDMSSLSEATIDQFDVNASGKGVSPNPIKGKKKRSSKKIKGSAKKVAKQIVVFVDNLSDTQNQKSHDSYSRPEIYTKDQIKNKTGRYLTSITSSVIQTPNEPNTDYLSPKNMKSTDQPKRQKLTHAASCSVLPESKVKNALKGVIQAQDSYISNNRSVKSIKQTNTSSMNTSANMTASFSHLGVKQSNKNPSHSLRKTPSSKPNSFHIAAMQQQTSNSQHMSVLDQSSSFQYQQQAATTQRRKMHKTHSQQILLSPSNNGTSKRMPTEPMSPTNNSKPLVNPYKKVMPVNSTQKTSNYLLKQKITINPDMIQSPLTTKTQQAHLHQRQQINQQTMHQESSHMKNLQSSSKSSKLQPTCPLSSDRRLRSPSQKSLSQAFNAVAKAISRRQSQTNSAAHTANQSRKHSIAGTSSQQNQ